MDPTPKPTCIARPERIVLEVTMGSPVGVQPKLDVSPPPDDPPTFLDRSLALLWRYGWRLANLLLSPAAAQRSLSGAGIISKRTQA